MGYERTKMQRDKGWEKTILLRSHSCALHLKKNQSKKNVYEQTIDRSSYMYDGHGLLEFVRLMQDEPPLVI